MYATTPIIDRSIAVVDRLIKKGLVKEFGYFLEEWRGYAIQEGEAKEVFESVYSFLPHYSTEMHEIMPWDKGKEIGRAVTKADVDAAKK